jgi:hypothetical protein
VQRLKGDLHESDEEEEERTMIVFTLIDWVWGYSLGFGGGYVGGLVVLFLKMISDEMTLDGMDVALCDDDFRWMAREIVRNVGIVVLTGSVVIDRRCHTGNIAI